MTRDHNTLRTVGEALLGPSWQVPLSELLGVSDRMVRYWVADDEEKRKPIPPGVWDDLAVICRKRAADLEQLASNLASPGFQTQVAAGPRAPARRPR